MVWFVKSISDFSIKWLDREKVDAGNQRSFGNLQPSFIHAHLSLLWKCCVCQTIRGNMPRRPPFSEIPCCFDASIYLGPVRHKERWRDYWCNISELIAGWCARRHKEESQMIGPRRTFIHNIKFVPISYYHSSVLRWGLEFCSVITIMWPLLWYLFDES